MEVHGLKICTSEQWSYDKTMSSVKKSFEAAIEAGFDLIHVDPTVDIYICRRIRT